MAHRAAGGTGPMCVCEHTRFAHTHNRPGTDCSFCGCEVFARRRWWRRKRTQLRNHPWLNGQTR